MHYRIKTYLFIALMPLLLTGCPPIQTVTPSVSVTSTPTSTPTASPTSTPLPIENTPIPTLALSIHQSGIGDDDSIHLIIGGDVQQISVGTDLVVYSKIETGAEIPIALLRVFAKTAANLQAQTIMLRHGAKVQANLRIDLNIDSLGGNEMEFAPSIPADGYLIADHFIYLRSGSVLSVGTELQTLKLVQPNAKIIGAVPALLPRLRVIASQGNVAEVELIEGKWPPLQTLVVVAAPTPTPTPTSSPTPNQANCVSPLPVVSIVLGASPVSVSRLKSPMCDEVRQFISDFTGNYLYLHEFTLNRRDDQYVEQIARGEELQRLQEMVVKLKEFAAAGDPLEITVDLASSYIEAIRVKSNSLIEVDYVQRATSNGGAGMIKATMNLPATMTLTMIDGNWYVTSSKARE